jgi:hypothetical protein
MLESLIILLEADVAKAFRRVANGGLPEPERDESSRKREARDIEVEGG